jgi:hypothetical protein
MKKIIFFSVMFLLLVAPAWGAVVIKLEQVGDTNEFKVVYDVNGESGRIRAFGLDITVDSGGKVSDANWLKYGTPKYQIYPGQIDINDTTGLVDDYGTPVCDPCDLPAGTTKLGLDTNGVTVEMGSLYVGTPNAPPSTGTLLSIFINTTKDCNIMLTGNAARVGPNSPPTPLFSPGIVMEDPDLHHNVLFKGARYIATTPPELNGTITLSNLTSGREEGKVVTIKIYDGSTLIETLAATLGSGGSYTATTTSTDPGTYDIYFERMPHWLRKKVAGVVLASPTTVNVTLTNGDIDGSNVIDSTDFGQLRSNYLKSNDPPLAADLDESTVVDSGDFGILRSNYLKSGDALP